MMEKFILGLLILSLLKINDAISLGRKYLFGTLSFLLNNCIKFKRVKKKLMPKNIGLRLIHPFSLQT